MQTIHRAMAFGLALALTLSVLLAIDQLASIEAAPAAIAQVSATRA